MKCEERNGSDITPFSRSDVHGTGKVKIRVIETSEMRTEFQELGRGKERGRGSKPRRVGMCGYANWAGARGVRLVCIVPQLHFLLRMRSGRVGSVKAFDSVDGIC